MNKRDVREWVESEEGKYRERKVITFYSDTCSTGFPQSVVLLPLALPEILVFSIPTENGINFYYKPVEKQVVLIPRCFDGDQVFY
jgi:hypothetical protein